MAWGPLSVPIFAYAVAITICGAFHGEVKEAFASFMSLRPLVVYFWAFDAFNANQRLQLRAVGWLLSLSAVAGLWGTVQQIMGYHPFGFHYLQGTGFLSGPMAFAGQMQLFSMLALTMWFLKGYEEMPRPFNHKLSVAAIVAGNVLGVIFASERSAWLGFAVAVFIAASLYSWRFSVRMLCAGTSAALIAWYCIPVFQKRLLPLLDWHHDISTQARLLVWSKSWSLFQDNPIFGVGVRGFPHIVIPEALVPGQPQYLAHAHSNYLHALATTGIVGCSLFIWLLCASLDLCWKQYCGALAKLQCAQNAITDTYETYTCWRFKSAIGLGLFAGLISLAIAGLFEYNFGTGQVRLSEWFLLALLMPVGSAFAGNAPADK